jgi:replicative DNA helicase
MYIDDTPNISAMELRTKARRLQAENGLDLVIVDYLQLMQATTTNRDANRVQEVSEISRGLKALARELSIPVIALSQLSRQPEMRESKEPRLSDLRESGAIEQDADLVMFIYRQEVYDGPTDKDGNSLEGRAEIIVGKQRNGPTGFVNLYFNKTYTRFENLSPRLAT